MFRCLLLSGAYIRAFSKVLYIILLDFFCGQFQFCPYFFCINFNRVQWLVVFQNAFECVITIYTFFFVTFNPFLFSVRHSALLGLLTERKWPLYFKNFVTIFMHLNAPPRDILKNQITKLPLHSVFGLPNIVSNLRCSVPRRSQTITTFINSGSWRTSISFSFHQKVKLKTKRKKSD